MNKIIPLTVFLSLACVSALGAVPRQYQIDMKLMIDGKLVSSPRIVVNEGKKAEISDQNKKGGDGNFMEVTAHRVPSDDDDQAFLQMVVGRIRDGKREIIGTPQVMALENEEAAMEVGEGEKQLFKVTVKVTREGEKKKTAAKLK